MNALVSGKIDLGPIDSYAFDLMKMSPGDPVHQLRVVAVTEPAPIPFLVAAPSTSRGTTDRLTAALLNSSADGEAKAILDRLQLKGFAVVDVASYEVLDRWDTAARDAGHACLD
ncbi:hypothetical protein AXW83_16740 [Bosea sp. PAMC 26642]|nr:hypothetical protein AXW83_16740 [Bosea sp. PAMC 26642]